jgi:hypothetical protein
LEETAETEESDAQEFERNAREMGQSTRLSTSYHQPDRIRHQSQALLRVRTVLFVIMGDVWNRLGQIIGDSIGSFPQYCSGVHPWDLRC